MAPVPDPNNPATPDELICQAGPQVIQVSSDSESDDEVDIHDGYVPLAQCPDTAQLEDSDTGSECSDSAEDQSSTPHVPVMPVEKAEQIKAVMANIKLPNIPTWARQVPEDQWMTSLMNNIQKNKEGTGKSQHSNHGHMPQAQSTSTQNSSTCPTDSKPSDKADELFDANFEAHFPAS